MTAYWRTLSHSGVCFPEPYSARGLSIKVKGKDLPLSPAAEELAYHLAKKKDTPYINDPVFTSNFMQDFDKALPSWAQSANFSDLDLSSVFKVVDQEKSVRESMSKESKRRTASERKERREALKARFGKANVDGHEVDIANWMVEPPGLFMGRGSHPLRGRWKPRVSDSDVVLNLDESAPVPPGKWKEVVHDHDSMWIAKWIDKLTDKEKYVWLHESSPLQQSRNKAKYDNAQKVGSNLQRIRDKILRELDSKDNTKRQVATVCYLIDALGMRVGDEKEEDEADTVGASTLRVEHLRIEGQDIEFDFLGKDSVPWKKRATPPPAVVRNLRELIASKRPEAEIFHDVNSGMVNEFLSSIVTGATAKVFRTFHATAEAEAALRSKDVKDSEELFKVYHAKEANLKAAVFCNHQRTPPKTWDESYRKKKQKLEDAIAKSGPHDSRVRKLQMEIDFFKRTKTYNLNTSLKNYIDPRLFKTWCDYVGLDWARIYSKSLQKKFSWATQTTRTWEQPVSTVGPMVSAPPKKSP